MSLLIVGDCHCSTSTLGDIGYAFKQITIVLKEENVSTLCFAGDIFDLHGTIKSEAYNFFIRQLKKWLKRFSELEIILIVGNHDFINNNVYCSDQHFLNPFKEWDRVIVVEKPQEYFIGEHRIALFPYVPDGRYFEAHNEFLEGSFEFELFISHQTFRGGKMDNGQPAEISETWAKNYPLQISGHLHTPHSVGKNLMYIGSMIHCKHSEEGMKRLLLIDFDESGGSDARSVGIGITEFELDPLELYQTVEIDIGNDSLDDIPKGKKVRYILTGGTSGELISFHVQHRKLLGSKVKYKADDDIVSLDIINDDIDPLDELREAINDPLIEELIIEQPSSGNLKLNNDKSIIQLNIGRYLTLEDRTFELARGITTIRGENGAGKSTLLKAIEWCLYGGNSPTKAKTSVELKSKSWTINRSTSPKCLVVTVEQDPKSQIYMDDAGQAIIDATFGNKNTWNTIYYLEQKERCKFFSYTDQDKKEFLANIFSRSKGLRQIGRSLSERENKVKREFETNEKSYQDLIELIGEEEEIPEPNLDDLNILEEPTVDDLEELEKPVIEEFVEPEPVYLDDLREQPKPEIEEIEIDLSAFEEINVGDFDPVKLKKELEKAKRKLSEAEKNNYEYQINEEKKKRKKELKGMKKPIEYHEKMLRIQKQIEELKDIEAIEYNIRELQKQNDNDDLKKKYQKKYGVPAVPERLLEIDEALKFSDAVEVDCPSCQTHLLGLIDRSQNLELIISTGQKKEDKIDNAERKALLAIDFNLADPIISMEIANQATLKLKLKKEFEAGNHQEIIDEQNLINAELKLLKIEDLEHIDIQKLEQEIEKMEEKKKLESIVEDNMRKRSDKERVLKIWGEQKRIREKTLKKWENDVKEIQEERQRRKKTWENDRKRLLEKWKKLGEEKMEEWENENKKRKREKKQRLETWKNENLRRETERKRRISKYEEEIKRAQKFKDRRTELQNESARLRELYGKLKDFSKICRAMEAKYFQQQLEFWNIIFNNVINQVFGNASGKIIPFRETKSGQMEKITLETTIDGITRQDIKPLSCGQKDLVSMAFQIALILVIPSPLKIILLDEPFSQLDKKRIEERMVEVVDEYLHEFYCFIITHDDNELGINSIKL